MEQCFTSRQHSIGYMGDSFYRSKDPTNSITVLKQKAIKENNQRTQRKHKLHICIDTQNSIQIQHTRINTASPLVYNNMRWLGDGSHRGQGCQAWTAVGCRRGTHWISQWCDIQTRRKNCKTFLINWKITNVIAVVTAGARWPSGTVTDLRSEGRVFNSRPWLLCTNAYSACHPSGVG